MDVTERPLPARLTGRPVSLSAAAGNSSKPWVDRKQGAAQPGGVTHARWHRGCIVYA